MLALTLIMAVLVLAIVLLVRESREGPLEEAGEAVQESVEKARDAAGKAAEDAERAVDKAGDAVQGQRNSGD
jgi:hypothetical protein